jgi:hypothetical protein
MDQQDLNITTRETQDSGIASQTHQGGDKPAWETPRLEDVSEQVMAQPYIRFT